MDLTNTDKDIDENDKIWRINSLTTFIDFDTKILLLPMPESKRKIKIKDTKYELQKIGDLSKKITEIEDSLSQKKQEYQTKRFED